MSFLKMSDLDLMGKKVLIREDLNVPLKDGKVTSDARIKAIIPTVELALKKGAAVMIMSHLGRPAVDSKNPHFSLQAVAEALSKILKKPVRFEKDWLDGVNVVPGEVVLLENVRFNRGEKENDPNLAERMAALCDVFVMDAFATAHRTQASTEGITHFAKISCAGPLLAKEIEAIEEIFSNPEKPLVAVVGGSKVSTKLKLLESLAEKVDCLIVGGGIANTFIAACGYNVGGSLYEEDLVGDAQDIMEIMESRKAKLPLPVDVIVADEMTNKAESYSNSVDEVDDEEKIFDIGVKTTKAYVDIIKKAGTILWNGPVGAFEIKQFSKGTEAIAKAIAKSKAMSIAGGGDTLAAIDQYHLTDKISYISTGGGAFLAYLQGDELPAIAALKKNAKQPSEA